MIFSINKKKKVLYYLIFGLIFGFVFFLSVSIFKARGSGYVVQYGGRIMETMPMDVCSNAEDCEACALCGCGLWSQVVIQPSGGSGFYFCPTFLAQKGNNPEYMPGGYVITGGSAMNALDPLNTTSIVKEDIIRGNVMLAWFKLLDLFS